MEKDGREGKEEEREMGVKGRRERGRIFILPSPLAEAWAAILNPHQPLATPQSQCSSRVNSRR